jgi:glycosyltransferase 2 family protein
VRTALNIRFFQRSGLPAAAALAVGVVDSFTGFLVEVFIILLFVLTGGLAELHLERSGNRGGLLILLLAVAGAVVISIGVAVPRLRRMLKDRLAEARETLSVLRQPTKLAQLFAGNLAARIALALVLSACLHALGQPAPLGALLVVNTVVALFAGLMPVPGGLGVYEGALTGGLVVIGIPDAAALAAALTYRMVTFYLPPIWGWFAMRALPAGGVPVGRRGR